MPAQYDAIVVGTGFASSFFLHAWLGRSRPDARVLVLESGQRRSHRWQLEHGEEALRGAGRASFDNTTPAKPWTISLALGGGSNCWWAVTPRLLPNDFRLHSRYGVGRDWPLGYDDLEPYYERVEEMMAVAGPERTAFPRRGPYPLPAHRLSDPDELLRAAHPDTYFPMPSARPSRALASGRPRCCASGVCGLCPVDSKFTVLNEMAGLFSDPRVELVTGASVQAVDIEAGVARGVVWNAEGERGRVEHRASGDLVVLGANAIFNPHILLRSGFEHAELGANLFEQAAVTGRAHLDGVDGFGGSTSLTAHGYMLYDGEHRRDRSAVLLESSNVPALRNERGKWRQLFRVRAIFEDLPRPENRVTVSADDPTRPSVRFERRSDELRRARKQIGEDLERVLAPLPIEKLEMKRRLEPTESHVLGTVVMGDDPSTSVVDRHLLHHQVRNLAVLGGSAFPVGSPSNPTLTISALSLWCADHLLGAKVGA